eukprot:c9552_g1_i2.p1 GENE.c9552_g1_i2~~c9552_g1_i2.p1  ORF type:complete len:165 (+),score=28.48 c9552_g1_i2:39-533(+)
MIIDMDINLFLKIDTRIGFLEGIIFCLEPSEQRIKNFYSQIKDIKNFVVVQVELFYYLPNKAQKSKLILSDSNSMIFGINKYLPTNVTQINNFTYQNLIFEEFGGSDGSSDMSILWVLFVVFILLVFAVIVFILIKLRIRKQPKLPQVHPLAFLAGSDKFDFCV